MIGILNQIVSSLEHNRKYQSLSINNSAASIYRRNIYKSTGIYEEYTLKLVFLIDDGEWFNKTVRFEIGMSSYNSELKVRSGYEDEYISFSFKDYKGVVDFIIQKIMKIQNKNFKYIKII